MAVFVPETTSVQLVVYFLNLFYRGRTGARARSYRKSILIYFVPFSERSTFRLK